MSNFDAHLIPLLNTSSKVSNDTTAFFMSTCQSRIMLCQIPKCIMSTYQSRIMLCQIPKCIMSTYQSRIMLFQIPKCILRS